MLNRTLNVGFIGAGGFSARHAEAISRVEGLRLAAVSRRDAAALQQFTDRFGGRAYTDYRRLLDDPDVQAVLIATPHHQHTQITLDAARAGKHILLEKPMAPTLAECDQIVDAAEKAGVTLMAGHVFRFIRSFVVANQIIASGSVGRPVFGISNMIKDWTIERRRPYHLDRALGGGVLMTAGMHSLDVLMWLAGSRVESVSASMSMAFHNQAAEDASMLQLRFANGMAGSVISAGYRTGAPTLHQVEMICTGGIVRAQPADGVLVGRNEQWQPVAGSGGSAWMTDALVDEWRGFAGALAASGPAPVSVAEARHVMATIFAAEESSRLRREVAVPI